jgi:hypothetical protein
MVFSVAGYRVLVSKNFSRVEDPLDLFGPGRGGRRDEHRARGVDESPQPQRALVRGDGAYELRVPQIEPPVHAGDRPGRLQRQVAYR